MAHSYSAHEIAWLRAHRALFEIGKLTGLFNACFDAGVSTKALAETCKRKGIKSGRDGRFTKGMLNYRPDKGSRRSIATEFKKGHCPKNHLPVGSERVNAYGYRDIKIADPNKWRLKHQLIWEALHGPIPRGHVIIFIDGDKTHLDPDNLAQVSRSELVRLNQQHFSEQPLEFRRTHLAVVKLEVKARERENP